MVTRPALDRFRPGIIACESSSVNLRGQLPTLPRNTATGMPGASTDLATMKSVSPAVALAAKLAANVTSPVTATADPAPAGAPRRCRTGGIAKYFRRGAESACAAGERAGGRGGRGGPASRIGAPQPT